MDHYFYFRAISKWIDLARMKAFARVELACQIDASITSNEIRHTSSYVDVCHVIDQLIWTWEHVEVCIYHVSLKNMYQRWPSSAFRCSVACGNGRTYRPNDL
jgi:hypothetical protein